jgi:hypothetical protein
MTGLGNLNGTENLNFAFDLSLPDTATPEPLQEDSYCWGSG